MSTSVSPLLQLRQVSLAFGRQEVLRDLTIDIPRSQTVAVIGESGCGKTVFLKLLIALIRPSAGQVFFDGNPWTSFSETDTTRQRLRMGFLFQGAALFDSLTVQDNVAFGLHDRKRGKTEEIGEIVRLRLQEVGLSTAILDKMPVELSGGMKKRVGLARALALEPEVMLYDEPTTGLDPIMSDVINELIVEARRRRPVTNIIVTHDMKTVAKVADRVLMLSPLSRLGPAEPQVLYDGPAAGLEQAEDVRVRQFVRGEAGDRLRETMNP